MEYDDVLDFDAVTTPRITSVCEISMKAKLIKWNKMRINN